MPGDRPSYWGILPASVRYDDRLTPAAKVLYTELTALTNASGECWASNRYFAALYGVNQTTVSEWVRALVVSGHVTPEYRRNGTRYLRLATDPLRKKPKGSSEKAEAPPSEKAEQNNPRRNKKREYPPSPATPKTEDQEPAASDDYRETTEQIGYEHLQARGRPPGFTQSDESALLAIIRQHGGRAVLDAFRRFLARTPQEKAAHWFVMDWESIWQPPRRPKRQQRRCQGCGAVLVSGSCLACGMAPGEPPEPRATAEDAKRLEVKR